MGFLDNAKDKLTKAVDQHGDKIAGGIDKAGKLVNERTGNKHADKVARATGKAREALDNVERTPATGAAAPPAAGAPAPAAPPAPAPDTAPDAAPDPAPATDPLRPPSQQPGLPTDPTNPATG